MVRWIIKILLGGLLLLALGIQAPIYGQAYPTSAVGCYELGEQLLDKAEFQAALAAFDEALRLDASYADAYYYRALTRERLGKLESALTDLNIFLEWSPTHSEAKFVRANLCYRLGLFALAKADYLELLQLPPTGATNTVFFRQNPHTGSVDKVFTSQSNNRSQIWTGLGLTCNSLGQYEEAILWYDSALLVEKTPDLLVNRGLAWMNAGKPNTAESDFIAAREMDPHHALAIHNLSNLLKTDTTGRSSLANQLLEEAIVADSTLSYSIAERAYSRLQAARYEEALADYDQAIAVDSLQSNYFLNRGLTLSKLKRYNEAFANYTTAIDLEPQLTEAWLNRGNVLLAWKRYQDAIDDYTVAITYRPEFGAAYLNRAIAFHQLGNRTGGCSDLKKARDLGMEVPARTEAVICGKP